MTAAERESHRRPMRSCYPSFKISAGWGVRRQARQRGSPDGGELDGGVITRVRSREAGKAECREQLVADEARDARDEPIGKREDVYRQTPLTIRPAFVERSRRLPIGGQGLDDDRASNREDPLRQDRMASSRPLNHIGSGGISISTSSARSRASAGTSARSNARTYRSRSVRSSAVGAWGGASLGARFLRVARARRSALCTELVDASSSSATSAALHSRTSRRSRIARCRGGRS